VKICEVVRCQVVGACVNSLAKQNRNIEVFMLIQCLPIRAIQFVAQNILVHLLYVTFS
jgi:hypothetical protein